MGPYSRRFFFFEISFAECCGLALGKGKGWRRMGHGPLFQKVFFRNILCQVLRPQRPSLPSVRHGTRQSIFVFFNFDFKFFL